jgi:hypothetical protein
MNLRLTSTSLKAKLMAAALLPLCAGMLAQPALATSVTIDNAPLQLDPEPIMQNGRVFVPLRGIFQALGASVVYENGKINATRRETTVALSIGSNSATISGNQATLDTPPFIVGASTYVPLRFVAQALGDYVSYDNSSSTVHIVSHDHNSNSNQSYNSNQSPNQSSSNQSYEDSSDSSADQIASIPPPPIPVYAQPPCPEQDDIWVPGYWAWSQQGYYWVPGLWTQPPAQNVVWTPGYWAANDGNYNWHPGYWAQHVGYYGGVSYGFGYYGHGFVGGGWVDNHFYYNVAVMNVNPDAVHHVYVDRHPKPEFSRADAHSSTVTNIHETIGNSSYMSNRYVNESTNRTSFHGGNNGVQTQPLASEGVAEHEHHYAATPVQRHVKTYAASDGHTFAKENHGTPMTPVVTHPERLPEHAPTEPAQTR